ncbi:calcium channel flower homolog [Physella acuta]|uniref:calcium channel flower homolog n=1 Tax=Physella acuta TaxID=109671 RepID=UPI0027DDC42D|nr:calcium channel flower homolog [Physella acuta]XP_059157356.1 calcium channel flower homolog [Physella acuta]XP_059157357.1 calcium channel flower homolog [Physella acuta]
MGQTTSGQNFAASMVSQGHPAGQKPDDGVTWWCKILATTCCIVAGLTAMLTGLFRLLTFTPLCLVAGILLMLLGFGVILLEAPCCCQFLDFIQPISRFSERRSYWQKAFAYALPAFIPPILCFSVTTMCGSALLIASGVVYGLIALGKKADRDIMLSRARGDDVEMKETLITNEVTPVPANP